MCVGVVCVWSVCVEGGGLVCVGGCECVCVPGWCMGVNVCVGGVCVRRWCVCVCMVYVCGWVDGMYGSMHERETERQNS